LEFAGFIEAGFWPIRQAPPEDQRPLG